MTRVLLLVALIASIPAASAQELGRLFFTEEQRAALDARRKARTPDRPSAPAVTSPSTRVDGYVRRGRATNSPEQLGHTASISAEHGGQKVHS
jgi:hypothetical protein